VVGERSPGFSPPKSTQELTVRNDVTIETYSSYRVNMDFRVSTPGA
jgi:hypothetical protein